MRGCYEEEDVVCDGTNLKDIVIIDSEDYARY